MNNKKDIQQDILNLQNKVVNFALIAFSFMAIIVHMLKFFRALDFGFKNIFFIQTINLFALFILTIFRKKILIKTKIYMLTPIVFVVLTTGLFSYGFLDSSKIYIVFLPIFMSFIVSYKKALLTLFILMLTYGIFGFFYINGILEYSFNLIGFASNKVTWILESSVFLLTSWALLYTGYYFRQTLISNYKEIENKNIELENHKKNLENIVKDKTKGLEASNQELKIALKQLKETQIQLLQVDKMTSLGILTAGVAHEINNPLNYIMGSYIGLEKYFNKNQNQDGDIKILLSSLKTGVDKASKIVEGLNEFSRSNENYTEECDIHSIIDNCLLILNNQLKSKIKVKKNFSSETVTILGNVGKLHQVFINILTNSIQSIDNKGFILVTTTKKNQLITIEISDTGCGIRKENLSKIINPFYTTKDPGKGTGLGLSIVYSIIQDHKGDMKFSSIKHKGTNVIITLPQKK